MRNRFVSEPTAPMPQTESSADGVNFRVQDGAAGIVQNRLNVRARQFPVAAQDGIPRFVRRQMFQNRRHGDARALDDRLPAANARVDLIMQ